MENSKNLIRITKAQALAMFLNYQKELSASGVAFSSMTYICDESKSKTKNGKKLLQKMVTTNATIGSDYAKKVNKILKDKQGQEINFEAQPMKGKEYVSQGNPICIDTKTRTKYYLVYIVEHHTKPDSQLILNGKRVERSEVWNEEYITPAGLNPKPSTSGRGSVNEENDFYFRTLNFDNLLSFNMNGNCYLIGA